MRLLHVIHSLSPAAGGPPEGLRKLLPQYRALGIEPEVVSQDAPADDFLKTVPATVHAVGRPSNGYGYSPALAHWLKDNVANYDLAVINGVWQYHTHAAWKALRGRVPYGLFTHGMLDPWFKRNYPLKHLKKTLYWRPFLYPTLRDAKAVFFTTETEMQLAPESFRPNRWHGVVVPYGTIQPEGDPAAQREAFYRLCPEAQGRRLLLFLGRLHEKKGCDLLIEAFAKVANSFPDLDLVMAGPDQVGLEARLRQQAAASGIGDRVHWPGMLSGDTKWGAFYASEAFVLPSHQENFGIAVAEALACGRPVLISNQVNIWQAILEDKVGLVDEDTLAGTHRLLSKWLEMRPEERAGYAERSLPSFTRRFSMKQCAAAVVATLKA